MKAVAARALVLLDSQPTLRLILVIMILSTTSTITALVAVIVGWFAFTRRGLLFSPQDIDPAVHFELYGATVPTPDVVRGVTYEVEAPEDDKDVSECGSKAG